MSPFIFTRRILAGEPIDVFNNGAHSRDLTYIDDIVEGVVRTLDKTATADPEWDAAHPDPATSSAPHRLYNIGNSTAVELLYLIECLEKALGKTAKKNFLPRQPGDMTSTWADVTGLSQAVGFRPSTPIERGVQLFVDWYKSFYIAG
jgi:UDP-glucuronate 4-epimerase